MPDAHRAKANVEIGETDPKQAHPSPEHMAAIETGDTLISAIGSRTSRKLITKSADQMSKRMTAKGVPSKQNDIDGENERSDSYPKRNPTGRIGKPKCFPDVDGENHDKDEREIEKIAVNVLHD